MKPKNSSEWRGAIVLAILVVFLIFMSLWNRGRFVAVPPVEVNSNVVTQSAEGTDSEGFDSQKEYGGHHSRKSDKSKSGHSSKKKKTKKKKKAKRSAPKEQPPRDFLDENP